MGIKDTNGTRSLYVESVRLFPLYLDKPVIKRGVVRRYYYPMNSVLKFIDISWSWTISIGLSFHRIGSNEVLKYLVLCNVTEAGAFDTRSCCFVRIYIGQTTGDQRLFTDMWQLETRASDNSLHAEKILLLFLSRLWMSWICKLGLPFSGEWENGGYVYSGTNTPY